MIVSFSLLLGSLPILLFAYYYTERYRLPVSPDALPSFLIPAYTTHARLLPIPSRHAFSYPLLYIGVDVGSLESGSLDLLGRLLHYGGRPITKILGMRSDGYLKPGKDTLRSKLGILLRAHGICASEKLGRVWLVTMPSFVGFEGINPLSVWYCYGEAQGEGRPELVCVVLEVHNTFGEK